MVIGVLSVGVKSRVEVLWSMSLRLRLKTGIGSGFYVTYCKHAESVYIIAGVVNCESI